jgi:hypothetical protein
MEEWCRVKSRFQQMRISSPPSDEEIAAVIDEVMDEAALLRRYPHLGQGGLDEHPNAYIEVGRDDGPLYYLDLYAGGALHFTKYADLDLEEEEFCRIREGVSAPEAERLWRLLRDGRLPEVHAAFEQDGSGDVR